MIKPDSGDRERATAKPGKTPAAGSLRPKQRFRVVEQAPSPEAVLPAPATSDRVILPRIKRSGPPRQDWKKPDALDLRGPIPSKSPGTR